MAIQARFQRSRDIFNQAKAITDTRTALVAALRHFFGFSVSVVASKKYMEQATPAKKGVTYSVVDRPLGDTNVTLAEPNASTLINRDEKQPPKPKAPPYDPVLVATGHLSRLYQGGDPDTEQVREYVRHMMADEGLSENDVETLITSIGQSSQGDVEALQGIVRQESRDHFHGDPIQVATKNLLRMYESGDTSPAKIHEYVRNLMDREDMSAAEVDTLLMNISLSGKGDVEPLKAIVRQESWEHIYGDMMLGFWEAIYRDCAGDMALFNAQMSTYINDPQQLRSMLKMNNLYPAGTFEITDADLDDIRIMLLDQAIDDMDAQKLSGETGPTQYLELFTRLESIFGDTPGIGMSGKALINSGFDDQWREIGARLGLSDDILENLPDGDDAAKLRMVVELVGEETLSKNYLSLISLVDKNGNNLG